MGDCTPCATTGFIEAQKKRDADLGGIDNIIEAYQGLVPLRDEVREKHDSVLLLRGDVVEKHGDVVEKHALVTRMSVEVATNTGIVNDIKAFILAMQSISAMDATITSDGELVCEYTDTSNITNISIVSGDLIVEYA